MRRAFTALVIVMLASACAHDAEPTATSAPRSPTASTSTTTTTWAPPRVSGHLVAASDVAVEVFDALGSQSPSRVVEPGFSGKVVFLVRKYVSPQWLHVDLPVKPNGSTGYIRRADVTLTRNTFAVDVLTRDHRLVVRNDDKVVFDVPIALGKAATPTPGGRFYITALLRSPNPSGDYGPYIYALSGFSPTLASFNGQDAVIGIHGTDEPATIGRDVSHGCIRLRNDDIAQLVDRIGLPLGTPVAID